MAEEYSRAKQAEDERKVEEAKKEKAREKKRKMAKAIAYFHLLIILLREFAHIFFGLPINPAWSPDGRFIAFSVKADDGVPKNDGIYIINVRDGAVQRLTNNGSYPVWLPDGQEIAFTFQEKVYIVNKSSYLVRRVLEKKGVVITDTPLFILTKG